MSTAVSERVPCSGNQRSTAPAAMPRIADTSDHAKPGARRARTVLIRPTKPLSSNSHPKNAVAASEGGQCNREHTQYYQEDPLG